MAFTGQGTAFRLLHQPLIGGYPGDLEADLGEVTVDAPGVQMVTINTALGPRANRQGIRLSNWHRGTSISHGLSRNLVKDAEVDKKGDRRSLGVRSQ